MSTVSVDKLVYNFTTNGIFRYIQSASSHCLKNRHLFNLLLLMNIIFCIWQNVENVSFLLMLSQRLCDGCITRVTNFLRTVSHFAHLGFSSPDAVPRQRRAIARSRRLRSENIQAHC